MYLKVSTIDESVGRIIKTLKANGLYENTLIGDKLKLPLFLKLFNESTTPSYLTSGNASFCVD